jgi:hypothetical protein
MILRDLEIYLVTRQKRGSIQTPLKYSFAKIQQHRLTKHLLSSEPQSSTSSTSTFLHRHSRSQTPSQVQALSPQFLPAILFSSPKMPTPESASFLAKKPKVPPTFDGVDYDDNAALKAAQDSIIREQWVKSMMCRLVRDELGKCYYREGVAHLEKCGPLRGLSWELFFFYFSSSLFSRVSDRRMFEG